MPPRIALDAHGTDRAPAPEIEGSLQAVEETGMEVALVGDRGRLEREHARMRPRRPAGLTLVHAPEVIAMDDEPSRAVRRKRNASMVKAFDLVKEGAADAVVTAGNSGAAMVLGLLVVGRLPGVARPAIVNALPNLAGGTTILLDGGANVDCRPEWLAQFGVMGSVYARAVLGIEDPRVGLLANGTEDGKGNETVKAAHTALKSTAPFRYVGLIEPHELFRGGIDVAVADGFAGNLILKTIEAVSETVFAMLKSEIVSRPLATLGAWLAAPAFRAVRAKADYDEYGAAPLLGIAGSGLIAHGRSSAKAIKNALLAARRMVESGANAQMITQLGRFDGGTLKAESGD